MSVSVDTVNGEKHDDKNLADNKNEQPTSASGSSSAGDFTQREDANNDDANEDSRKVNDISESFSRREKDLSRGANSQNAPGSLATASSSAYSDAGKQTPAWLKKKQTADKYDKYGTRAGSRDNAANFTSTEESTEVENRYAKYLKEGQQSQSRDARGLRGLQTEDSGSDSRLHRRREEDSGSDSRLNRRREESSGREREYKRTAYDNSYGFGTGGGDDNVASYSRAIASSNILSASSSTGSNYQQFKSHIENKHEKDINSIVRTHYNQKTYHSRKQGSRTLSPIYKLRNFNNTIKYILLGNFVKKMPNSNKPTVILDLCCGKGGDLNKYEFIGIDQLIGIDISDASVKEAFKRYTQNKARLMSSSSQRDARKYNFESCFATGDCFSRDIPDILEPNFPGIINNLFPVDCVSIQFALHYAFETEDKVKTLLNNVSKSLRSGGTFIGTIPLSDFIRDKIVKNELSSDGKKFGNELYSVTFHDDPPKDGVFRPPFGNGYDFSLTDAIDDVPEYVVPFEILRLMCEDYGLILKYKKNFVDLFNQEIPKYFGRLNKNLIEGMKRSDGKYGAEGAEKEAVAFYLGFVFEKVGA